MLLSVTSVIKFVSVVYYGNLSLDLLLFRLNPNLFCICSLRNLNLKLKVVYIRGCRNNCRFTFNLVRTLLTLVYPWFIECNLRLICLWRAAAGVVGADSFCLIKSLFASLTGISRLFSFTNSNFCDFKGCLNRHFFHVFLELGWLCKFIFLLFIPFNFRAPFSWVNQFKLFNSFFLFWLLVVYQRRVVCYKGSASFCDFSLTWKYGPNW